MKAAQLYRKKQPSSYAIGVYPTLELLQYQRAHVIEVMLHSQGTANSGVAKIKALCQQHKVHASVNDGYIEKLSDKDNVYAIGVFKKYASKLDAHENHLALVNPSDLGNLGTIMRTQLGFNCRNLALIQPAADIFHPKAIRAAMGAVFQINFAYFETIEAYQQTYEHHLYPFMTNGERLLANANFQQPFTLIFGTEASGLPDKYRRLGQAVTIPQSLAVDSLNVSVAAGIGLYIASLQQSV